MCATTAFAASAAQSVTLAWNPSSNTDIAGYDIYYGYASHIYTNEISVGDVTNATVSGLVEGTTYYFAAKARGTSGVVSDFSNEATYTVPSSTNLPPTLNPISNVTFWMNSGQQRCFLSGISSGSSNSVQNLEISAVSSNPSLIPDPTVSYTSPNFYGLLTFTPAANATGTATITVTVNNGQPQNNTVTKSFTVTVTDVNQPPTLDPISNLSINENSGTNVIALSGITSGASYELQKLTVTAVSSNPGLIPNPTVNYLGPFYSGTLVFLPAANAYGTATITVTVNDGQTLNNLVTQSFIVNVSAVNQPPTFDPIGNLTVLENSGPQTVNISGISSGAANENQTLTISAVSSNPNLVPNPSVNYTSPNATGTLSFTPVSGASGAAIIMVSVNDGGLSNNVTARTFAVSVLASQPASATQSVTLAWNPSTNSDIAGYDIFYGGASHAYTNEISVGNVTSATIPDLVEGETYYFAAKARSTSGVESDFSNEAIYTVPNAAGGQLASAPLPVITRQPTNHLAIAGKTTTFNVSASTTDGSPLVYQWQFNSVNLPFATNAVLTLTNVTPEDAGLYSVNVSGGGGSINSTPAALTVFNSLAATLVAQAPSNGAFAFTVGGVPGYQYVVQASTNMADWISLETNTAPFVFVDSDSGRFRQRFYRSFCVP